MLGKLAVIAFVGGYGFAMVVVNSHAGVAFGCVLISLAVHYATKDLK